MKQNRATNQIAQFVPTHDRMIGMVREIAADSAKVFFGNHCQERMELRGITTLDALRVLRSGEIKGHIEAGRSKGEWKCKLIRQMKGSREIGVISVVTDASRIFVKTVEWEDL